MALTFGPAPLAGEHAVFLQADERRLRPRSGTRFLADTTRATLVHETGSMAVPYLPQADVDERFLEPSETTYDCPHKGRARFWHVVVDGVRHEDGAWQYHEPLPGCEGLAHLVAFAPAAVDAWFVEDELNFGSHLKDPFHRVDVHESSRTVEVRVHGTLVARSERPKMLFETSLGARPYLPIADVEPGVLRGAERRAVCPYKGQSTYRDVVVDGRVVEEAAWVYEAPLPEAIKVQEHVAFDDGLDGVEVVVGPPRR